MRGEHQVHGSPRLAVLALDGVQKRPNELAVGALCHAVHVGRGAGRLARDAHGHEAGVGDEFGLRHRAQPQPARHGFADGFAAADFKIGARLHAGGAQGAFRIAAEEAQARWDKACNEFLKNALLVVLVVVAGFLAIKFWTPAPPAQPVQATPPPAAAQAAKPTAPPAAAKTAKKPPPKPSKPRTVEQCLKIADEHVMVRCLERAP